MSLSVRGQVESEANIVSSTNKKVPNLNVESGTCTSVKNGQCIDKPPKSAGKETNVTSNPKVKDIKHIDHGKALMDWLKMSNEGFFHENLEIRRTGEEGSPYYGMFSTNVIHKNDLMIKIPRAFLVHPAEGFVVGDIVQKEFGGLYYPGVISGVNPDGTFRIDYDDGEKEEAAKEEEIEIVSDECKTVDFLTKEMKLGSKSKLSPYINYLNSQPRGQLPSGWSKAGKKLFLQIVGARPGEDVGVLPPYEPKPLGHVEAYQEDCNSLDPFDEHAYLLLLQRGWDDLMIPVFDMMSHGNGHWLNTKIPNSVHDVNRPIVVQASRDIQAGEEIFTTYNFCEDCGNRKLWYGTPELLRDYGFVERYPQRWVFPNQDTIFDLDLERNDKGVPIKTEQHPAGKVSLKWERGYKLTPENAVFFVDQLERLGRLGETVFKTNVDNEVPEHEWEFLLQFRSSMEAAMQMALENSSPPPPKPSVSAN